MKAIHEAANERDLSMPLGGRPILAEGSMRVSERVLSGLVYLHCLPMREISKGVKKLTSGAVSLCKRSDRERTEALLHQGEKPSQGFLIDCVSTGYGDEQHRELRDKDRLLREWETTKVSAAFKHAFFTSIFLKRTIDKMKGYEKERGGSSRFSEDQYLLAAMMLAYHSGIHSNIEDPTIVDLTSEALAGSDTLMTSSVSSQLLAAVPEKIDDDRSPNIGVELEFWTRFRPRDESRDNVVFDYRDRVVASIIKNCRNLLFRERHNQFYSGIAGDRLTAVVGGSLEHGGRVWEMTVDKNRPLTRSPKIASLIVFYSTRLFCQGLNPASLHVHVERSRVGKGGEIMSLIDQQCLMLLGNTLWRNAGWLVCLPQAGFCSTSPFVTRRKSHGLKQTNEFRMALLPIHEDDEAAMANLYLYFLALQAYSKSQDPMPTPISPRLISWINYPYQLSVGDITDFVGRIKQGMPVEESEDLDDLHRRLLAQNELLGKRNRLLFE